MHDLKTLDVSNVLQMSSELQRLGDGCSSMEEAAKRVVRYFYEGLRDDKTGQRTCALVRLYRTTRFEELDFLSRGFAKGMAKGHPITEDTVCLTLLATSGDEETWNSRERSIDHMVIPLLSEEVVQQMPMVAQLIQQLGYDVKDIINPNPDLLLDPTKRTHNVFWVPEARGNPYIPAQQGFVVRYGIRSVVGFGSILPGGPLFAVILFLREAIPEQQAGRFKSLTVSVRAALSRHSRGKIFE